MNIWNGVTVRSPNTITAIAIICVKTYWSYYPLHNVTFSPSWKYYIVNTWKEVCFSYPENALVGWIELIILGVDLCQQYQKADEHHNTTQISEHVPMYAMLCVHVHMENLWVHAYATIVHIQYLRIVVYNNTLVHSAGQWLLCLVPVLGWERAGLQQWHTNQRQTQLQSWQSRVPDS